MHLGVILFVLAAQDAGYFNAEMAPIEVKTRKGKETMEKDEHPKPQTTPEQLAKLPCVFKKDGTVTAGNASVSTSRPRLLKRRCERSPSPLSPRWCLAEPPLALDENYF